MGFHIAWGVSPTLMFINTPPQKSSAQELYIFLLLEFSANSEKRCLLSNRDFRIRSSECAMEWKSLLLCLGGYNIKNICEIYCMDI